MAELYRPDGAEVRARLGAMAFDVALHRPFTGRYESRPDIPPTNAFTLRFLLQLTRF